MNAAPNSVSTDIWELRFGYTNWEGRNSERRVRPISVRYGQSKWHPRDGWLMLAFDLDKNEEREFSMRDMVMVERSDAIPLSAAQGSPAALQTSFDLGFRAAGGGCHLPPSAEALFQSWLRDGFAVSQGREREEEIPAAAPQPVGNAAPHPDDPKQGRRDTPAWLFEAMLSVDAQVQLSTTPEHTRIEVRRKALEIAAQLGGNAYDKSNCGVSWSDEDYARARQCMVDILRNAGWSITTGDLNAFDNALQHAVGILALTASSVPSTEGK